MTILNARFTFPFARSAAALTLGAFLAITIALTPTVAAHAEDAQPVWLISTRDAACNLNNVDNSANVDLAKDVRYWRLQDDGEWADASAREFHATDAAQTPTAVFIHGNGTSADDAVQNGFCAYETIRQAVGDRPFRFVIWSWPAERILRGRRSDILWKAMYSDKESRRLAVWLNELPPHQKICLIGHSFGPRMIADSLQLLAGGEVADQQLPKDVTNAWTLGKRGEIRAVLLAPAIDEATFAQGGRHDRALSLIDQAVATVNRRDCALAFYPLLEGHGGPRAAGRVGPCVDEKSADKIAVVDVGCTVGKTHDCQRYCLASNLIGLWPKYLFFDSPSNKDK